MQRILPGFGVLLLAVFGAWGCAKAPEAPGNVTERLKALEAKNTRLEGDIRAAGAVRDQLRQQIADNETTQTRLRDEIDQLQLVVKERDAMKKQIMDMTAILKVRTGERDSVNNQFESFRRQLRAQLDQMETSTSSQAMPAMPSALSGS